MALSAGRFSRLRWIQNAACVIAILGAIILIGLGIAGSASPEGLSRVWLVVGGGVVLFISVMLMTITPLLLKMESTAARQLSAVRDLNEVVSKQNAILELIVENTHISDAAKALAHRDQELDALRTAIRDDVRNEQWELALNLVDEVEKRFGYKEEADRIREEVDDARNSAIQSKLSEAIEMIESHFQSHQWDRAQSEIDRLLHALPDHAMILALQDRMEVLKTQHKDELKLDWNEAVRRSDTDRAIDVLRELDQYLSTAEAEALQSSARDVFKEKLLQLGVQFRFAVTERRWNDALAIGLELIREFPNARMASEVRDAMDTLRERARTASEPQTPKVTS